MKRRRVLLVATNTLYALYLDKFKDLFAADPRLEFHATGGALHPPKCPLVDFDEARRSAWDLAVFASPGRAIPVGPGAPDILPPEIPSIRVLHGLSSTLKTFRPSHTTTESHYTDFLHYQGRSRFTKFFEASFVGRDRIVAQHPDLAPHVTVVGDLRLDVARTALGRRALIRQRLGVSPRDVMVVVMSTWGTSSLMFRFGRELMDEAVRLQREGGMRFIVTAHPLLWEPDARSRSLFGDHGEWSAFLEEQRARGLAVLGCTEDWEEALAAADVAVSDHTSLGMTFAMLGKPLILVPLGAESVAADSAVREISTFAPRLDTAASLRERVHEALESFPLDRLDAIVRRLTAHPYHAADRMREETYAVLGLTGPTAAE